MAFCECGRRCGPRIPARLVRWAWVGKKGDGQRDRWLSRSLQEISAGHGPLTCRVQSNRSSGVLTPSRSSGTLSPRELESCGRLVQPLLYKHGQKSYCPIEWPQAMERVVAKLKSLPARKTFWYLSGRSSNEAGFLLLHLRPDVWDQQCEQLQLLLPPGSGVGLTSSLGSGTATLLLETWNALIWFCDRRQSGQQPSSADDDLDACATARRRRDRAQPCAGSRAGRVSVPSNLRSMLFWTKIASLYIQPHVGVTWRCSPGSPSALMRWRHRTNRFSAPIVKTTTSGLGTYGRSPGANLHEVGRSTIRDQPDRREVCSGQEGGFQWTMELPIMPTRAECAGDCQPGLDASHGGAPSRRFAAYSRPFQMYRAWAV